MGRRFINQLGEHEMVKETFLVGGKQLRQNRNGDLYLQMVLSDRTGAINGMLWNANDYIANRFENGDFVEIEGKSQIHNGSMQIIVNRIDRAEPGSINEEDFIFISKEQIARLTKELSGMLREMEDLHIRTLAECFLADEEFMNGFTRAPAAVKNHHAFHGGLMAHVVNLMKAANAIAPLYPAVDTSLLVMGAFLHDIGKIDELHYTRDLGYSDEGQLIGHLVMGVSMLENKVAESEKLSGEVFPEETALRLKHMIVSHHGHCDFGSPKVPMTPEAIALHLLDDLDAKVNHFENILNDDANAGNWTSYHPGLGRKLFRGERVVEEAANKNNDST